MLFKCETWHLLGEANVTLPRRVDVIRPNFVKFVPICQHAFKFIQNWFIFEAGRDLLDAALATSADTTQPPNRPLKAIDFFF